MFLKMIVSSLLLILGTLEIVQSLIVRTEDGLIKGKYMKSQCGRKLIGFVGIPYAEPPIGPLRFMPPVPKERWYGVRESLNEINSCPQIDYITKITLLQGAEDCLYLNVFTPIVKRQRRPSLLPVMFFIHGGAFSTGHGNIYTPEILLDNDAVLVVINYRLGALGFFTTGDDVVAGNNGLKDQNLALKWTKRNIRAFGGDPNRITLIGQSAGGASVHMHMMSPLSKGLFHRAISQSGTALALWNFDVTSEAIKTGKELATSFGCPIDDNTEMVRCLREQDAYDFVINSAQFVKWIQAPATIFKPIAEHEHDGAFLTKHPVRYIKDGQIENVPWMTGINSEEGSVIMSIFINNPELFDQYRDNFDWIMPISLGYQYLIDDVSGTTDKLKEYYFTDGIISEDKVDNITNLYTDGFFYSTVDASIRLHLDYIQQSIYYYLFAYRGSYSLTELFSNSTTNYGVAHFDELFYLFPMTALEYKPELSTCDKRMSRILSDIWYNFARTGRPSTSNWNNMIVWNTVSGTSDELEYFNISGPCNLRQDIGLYMDRINVWRPIIDEIINSIN